MLFSTVLVESLVEGRSKRIEKQFRNVLYYICESINDSYIVDPSRRQRHPEFAKDEARGLSGQARSPLSSFIGTLLIRL